MCVYIIYIKRMYIYTHVFTRIRNVLDVRYGSQSTEPSCGWGVERWEGRGRRVGRGGGEIGRSAGMMRGEVGRGDEEGEREERSRRAVSWRLRTVSWNEFCWINKFHYKNTLALSRGVSGCWFYPCLSVSANRYTGVHGSTPSFSILPFASLPFLFTSLFCLTPLPSLPSLPLSMYPAAAPLNYVRIG